jgi:hypothetical protein
LRLIITIIIFTNTTDRRRVGIAQHATSTLEIISVNQQFVLHAHFKTFYFHSGRRRINPHFYEILKGSIGRS